MDRAGSNDDEKSVQRIGVLDNGDTLVAARKYGSFGGGCLRDLMLEQVGWCERVITTNWRHSVFVTL